MSTEQSLKRIDTRVPSWNFSCRSSYGDFDAIERLNCPPFVRVLKPKAPKNVNQGRTRGLVLLDYEGTSRF